MRVYTREQLLDMSGAATPSSNRGRSTCTCAACASISNADDANPELILTVRSVGYRFNPERLIDRRPFRLIAAIGIGSHRPQFS